MLFQTFLSIKRNPLEQVIQSDLLVNVLGMDIRCNAVCRNHDQLNGVCLRMLLTIQERLYLIAKFLFVCLVNGKLMFTELHFTNVVCALAFPFQNKVYLAGVTAWSNTAPTIVSTDGSNAQLILYLRIPYPELAYNFPFSTKLKKNHLFKKV